MNKILLSVIFAAVMFMLTTNWVVRQANAMIGDTQYCQTMQQLIELDKKGLDIAGNPTTMNYTAIDTLGYLMDCANYDKNIKYQQQLEKEQTDVVNAASVAKAWYASHPIP